MTITEQLLLQHDGWLRKLAARLVDDGSGDDLAQEVWHAVALRPPAEGSHWRAWLATVARRLAGRQQRSDFRRVRREEVVARLAPDEVDYDPERMAERFEQRQRVAALVFALDAPFREVVLLRYFEGLQPSEIAVRIDIPAGTVRTRLHRAHDKLRELISEEEGSDWRPWLAALVVPLPRSHPQAMSAMGVGSFIAVCVSLLSLGIWWWLDSNSVPVSIAAPLESVRTTVGTAVDFAPDRDLVASAVKPELLSQPAVAPRILRGVVTDHVGVRIPNVPIVIDPNDSTLSSRVVGHSDQDGAFQIPADAMNWCQSGRLVIEGNWQTVQFWRVGQTASISDDALIIAAPRLTLRGRLVDSSGEPIPKANLWPFLSMLVGYPESHAGTGFGGFRGGVRVDVDDDGRYRVENVPACPGFMMRVSARGFEDTHLTAFDFESGQEVVTVMQSRQRKRAASAHSVRIGGSLRDHLGKAVAGGRCRIAGAHTNMGARSSEDGEFELWRRSDDTTIEWFAGAPGFAPQRGLVEFEKTGPEFRLDIVLQRDGPRLAGIVVDKEGEPQPGLIVCIADPVSLTAWPEASNPMAGQSGENAKKNFGVNDQVDERGRFELGMVLERTHRLRVIDPAQSWAMTFEQVWPGEHRLVVPKMRDARPFRGRVVSSVGKPIIGVHVRPVVEKYRWLVAGCGETAFHHGPEDVTDEDGRFVIEAAPSCEFVIHLNKVGFDDHRIVWGADEPRDVALVFPALRLVRFDVPDLYGVVITQFSERFSGLVFRDARGKELEVHSAWRGTRRDLATRPGIAQGRSEVLAISERAVVAQLINKDGSVWREEALFLREGRVQVVTFPW